MKVYLKFYILLFFSILIFTSRSEARVFSYITNITAEVSQNKVFYTFQLNREAPYSFKTSEDSIEMIFYYTIPKAFVKKPSVQNFLVKHISISNSEKDTVVKIPLRYPVLCKKTIKKNPWSITIEIEKIQDKVFSKDYGNGIEYKKIIRRVRGGFAEINLIKVNPKFAEIFPAIPKKYKKDSSFFESLLKFLNLFHEEEKPFMREKVSKIAKDFDAPFAVNGTFFSSEGLPLGILMIKGNLIASPIYERTAFAIKEDGTCYIDNFIENNFVLLEDGSKIQISGINRARGDNEVILFTPFFGDKTKTDTSGIELTISNDKIVHIQEGNSTIPEDGLVISFSKNLAKLIKNKISYGEKIKLNLSLIPISQKDGIKTLHIIGGGPRLVKAGRVYVSKKEERFRKDIAESRAARTAVSIDKDGNIMFVTVDGKPRHKKIQKSSEGMLLEELSEFLIDYGAVEAMNLDGGGSSTMIVGGELKNNPVNGCEVSVSNAILIKPKDLSN